MSTFLDMLRQRMTEAQKRTNETQKAMEEAQVAHDSATRDYNSWARAFQAEAKREGVAASSEATGQESRSGVPEGTDANQTELVRQVLRQNPTGVTPAEIWGKLKKQIPRRNYVYSILGRLKQRDQVSVRNGKYRPKLPMRESEGNETAMPIQ
jgi:hypothetical protein